MRVGGSLLVASALVAGCSGGSTTDRSGWGASPPPDLLDGLAAPQLSASSTTSIATGSPVVTKREPCNDVRTLSATFSGCSILRANRVTASGGLNLVTAAGDGDACTTWNAGNFAPQSITIDLGSASSIDGIALLPAMTPGGNVVHRIELSDDGSQFAAAHRIEAPMADLALVELRFPKRERARFVRISTQTSPSWIAWRELTLVRCGTN